MLIFRAVGDIFPASKKGRRNEGNVHVVVKKVSWSKSLEKIPTTFVPLAPEKLIVEENIDLLVGVFHIMWADMPRRRTYRVRLQELVSGSGNYFGTRLKCGQSNDLLRELK